MSEVAIKVVNISKKYDLLHQAGNGSNSLIGAFAGGVKQLLSSSSRQSKEEFWALKDISFEVKKGDRIGIIGRNGAGKSTLLKVLSRIVKPTTGRIEYQGRMASLLEVGTGFHGDLSGRENIYLNGSILGMSKSEIDARFDEIVAFSEIEQFLDTPVKRYSSGMYVRLAFSVAAHLEPEILIVDEVLAVGDTAFQEKCLGKMNEVSAKDGRTILFVSHQMAVVSALCNNSVLLQKGRVTAMGPTASIIQSYLQSGEIETGQTEDNSPAAANAKLKIRSVKILDNNLSVTSEVDNASNGFIDIGFEVFKPGRDYDVSLEIKHTELGTVFTTCLKDAGLGKGETVMLSPGFHNYRVKLPVQIMRGGSYMVSAGAAVPKVEVLDNYKFDTIFSILDSTSPVAKTTEGRSGIILPVIEWVRSANK